VKLSEQDRDEEQEEEEKKVNEVRREIDSMTLPE